MDAQGRKEIGPELRKAAQEVRMVADTYDVGPDWLTSLHQISEEMHKDYDSAYNQPEEGSGSE